MTNIYVVGKNIYLNDAVSRELGQLGTLTHIREDLSAAQFGEFIKNADALITYVKVDAAAIQKLPQLKVLCFLSTGYDECLDSSVDREFCAKQKLFVCNTPAAATESVASYTVAALLAAMQKLAGFRGDPSSWLSYSLDEFRVGIVGMGAIGTRVAELLAHLSIPVCYFTRTPSKPRQLPHSIESSSLEELCSCCNAIAITCELNSTSKALINSQHFAQMKDDIVLVNAARCEIFNLPDILGFLSTHPRACAIIDDRNRLESLCPELLQQANLHPTPHIAFLSKRSLENYPIIAAQNLSAFFAGQPINGINFDR